MNLWQFENPPNADQEVIVDRFTFIPVGTVVGIQEELPRNVTSLSMARPNPFNPSTTIAYTVMKRGHTEILIYDVSGRRVRTLVSRVSAVGTHEVVWDGRDDSGRRVASGVYLYRLRAGDVVDTKKMVLLK